MKYIRGGELDDTRIINALRRAAQDYENGEVLEVRDALLEIIAAIDEFDKLNEERYK